MCSVPAHHTQCPECDLQHCQKKIVQVVSGVCNVFVIVVEILYFLSQ